nr:hypothetical protein [Tanacetum cinerariifolium]
RDQVDDLMPTIEEGKVIKEELGMMLECDDMDAYCDEGIGLYMAYSSLWIRRIDLLYSLVLFNLIIGLRKKYRLSLKNDMPPRDK